MRLIVHIGLHKTASTWLQHLFNDNAEALAQHGVYYQRQPGYPAHHDAAWQLLVGRSGPLDTMFEEARAARCDTLVLSSEDLEAAIFHRAPIDAIETAAARAGASIEWHAVLRDPGACFASLFAQLQHHVYADATAMFYAVMRTGALHIADPMAGALGTPYWHYCFDAERHLTRFAAATRFPVIAHDFDDGDPYPGWRMLAAIGASEAVTALPGTSARNARMAPLDVAQGYVARMLEAVGDDDAAEAMLPGLEASLRASLDSVDRYAAIVHDRYEPGRQAALATFRTQSSRS
ncbi:hypothetical protein [Sphingomonas japonica]|uniref:Sulfotransferase family protein n=1 Tax=Sphingomonas japonica TaxID=511662 RepID=A0ABX0TYW2_9SPHN|nr:hypothetical protein [Sphingomonas japonica]NIJ23506.1 hypothetical protein [Sphingomonas japonica]